MVHSMEDAEGSTLDIRELDQENQPMVVEVNAFQPENFVKRIIQKTIDASREAPVGSAPQHYRPPKKP